MVVILNLGAVVPWSGVSQTFDNCFTFFLLVVHFTLAAKWWCLTFFGPVLPRSVVHNSLCRTDLIVCGQHIWGPILCVGLMHLGLDPAVQSLEMMVVEEK